MKPTRVRWRAVALFFAGLVTVALAVSLGLRLYGRHRLEKARASFEARGHSLALHSYELPEPPTRENAGRWLQAGASAIVLPREAESRVLHLISAGQTAWTDEQVKEMEEVLKDNEGGLLTLRRAVPLARSSFGILYREGLEARMPALSPMRQAVLLLGADTRVALRLKQRDRALAALRTLSRLADALGAEALVSMQLMAGFTESEYLKLASEVATSRDPRLSDAQLLAGLLDSMPQRDRVRLMGRALAYTGAAWCARGDDFMSNYVFGVSRDDSYPVERAIELSFTELTQAMVLESFLRHVDAVDRDVPADSEGDSSFLLAIPRTVVAKIVPHRKAGWYAKGAMGHRELVRGALELRTIGAQAGAYPSSRPTLPALDRTEALLGRPVAYEPQPDGSLRLDPHDRHIAPLTLPPPVAAPTPSGLP